jgi:hypothetical protein
MTAGPNPPLLTPAQAKDLLEQVLFEQVVECLDLDALYRLEQSLTMLVGEIDGVASDKVADTARAMLDRALLRLPDNVRAYLNMTSLLSSHCELCEDEARGGEPRPRRKPRDPRSPVRFNS